MTLQSRRYRSWRHQSLWLTQRMTLVWSSTAVSRLRIMSRPSESIQNAAARLVMGTRRRDHITPVLRDLHWLPVRRRVDYKLALLVFKSLQGLAPPYLADDCILASSDKFRRRLRSADVDTCIVPRTRTRFGDRSFSAAGPHLEKLTAGSATARH